METEAFKKGLFIKAPSLLQCQEGHFKKTEGWGSLTPPPFHHSQQGANHPPRYAPTEGPGAWCTHSPGAWFSRASPAPLACKPQGPAGSEGHLSLYSLPACFYRAAFFCHFWLREKLCLNKQEGVFFGSSLSPLLFPLVFWLFLPSLFIASGAQTLAELLRLRRGCSSHKHAITFHFAEREKEQMLGAGSCPGDGVIGTDAESDLRRHRLAHSSGCFKCQQRWRALCRPLTKPARQGQAGGMKLSNKLQSSSPLGNCRVRVGASLPCKGAFVKCL